MSWLTGLFGGVNKLWAGLGAIVAGLLAVLAIFRSGKSAGVNEVVVESTKKELEDVKEARKVERDVAARKPGDVQQRLRDKYSRD